MKKKKIIFRLLPWVIAAAALACLVIFVGIPLYGPQPASTLPAPEIVFYEGKTKSMTMENDDLLFEFNPATTYFTVTDKASGQQWHSTPKDAAKDPKAIPSNKELLQSTLIVTYTNSSVTTISSPSRMATMRFASRRMAPSAWIMLSVRSKRST